eukprot:3543272-Heterocapsa_arctica.AAC.1
MPLIVELLGSGLKRAVIPPDTRSHAAQQLSSSDAYRSAQPCRLIVELLGSEHKSAGKKPLDS